VLIEDLKFFLKRKQEGFLSVLLKYLKLLGMPLLKEDYVRRVKMPLTKFDEIIEVVLEHEGGYVNDPDDPGGETNFGIAKRSHPDVDIKNLTKEGAKKSIRKYIGIRIKLKRYLNS